jgi:tRNA threonylcarbamoyladenosine biosynthesis protein TsaE
VTEEVHVTSPQETRAVACSLGALLEPGDVILLAGPLGAGKTEFAKGVAEGLGVEDRVVSPTFTLAREYQGRLRMIHVDVYRLDAEQEVLDLGLEDFPEGVLLVEWGDVARGLFPADHLEVRLDPGHLDEHRIITLTPVGPSWMARVLT